MMTKETLSLPLTLKGKFDRDGFLVVRSFFSGDEVSTIGANVDRYVRDVASMLPPGDVMYEDKDRPETLKQMPHIAEHDAWFRKSAKGFASYSRHFAVVNSQLDTIHDVMYKCT